MSNLIYKVSIGVLLLVALLLAWRCLTLYRQMVTAAFISGQCEMTEDHSVGETNPAALAQNLEFLTGYYRGYSRTLVGSPIYRVVERDYQHALTNTLTQFRSIATNDLGSDPRVWIQKYGK